MLIGFTGAQSTGKTTLLNRCKKELRSKEFTKTEADGITTWGDKWKFVDEVTRKVMRQGWSINEDGDNLTQLFILKEHLQNHTTPKTENWVLDRCILDGYVYTRWLKEQGAVDTWVLTYAGNLLSILGKHLDVIFYTEPGDVPIEDDGERSVDVDFRNDIIKIYEELMTASVSTPGRDTWRKKIVRLSGTVDERMKTIYDKIETLKNE